MMERGKCVRGRSGYYAPEVNRVQIRRFAPLVAGISCGTRKFSHEFCRSRGCVMAQEQAKSTGAAAPESKDERPNPLEAMMKNREEKPDAPADRAPELPRRTSLAERLKAEQRKREAALGGEAKRNEAKS